MKKIFILSLVLSLAFPVPVSADGLFGLFRHRQQVQQVQYYQQPTYYYQQQQYQVVAAVPLATVPVAIDLQSYIYSVNAGAFQSFREYMNTKGSVPPEQPTETVAPVQPRSDDTHLAGAQVLQKNCAGCHSTGKNPKSNFAIFDQSGNMYSSLPFNDMLKRINSLDPNERMPPKKKLSDQEKTAVFDLAVSSLSTSGSQVASESVTISPFD